MAIYSVKATKKKRACQSPRVRCTVPQEENWNVFRFVLFWDRWLRGAAGEICWLGFKTSVYSTSRFQHVVSACCSSPPGPSSRCRSGVGWSPSPGRTISHNTLRHQCCPQRKAGWQKQKISVRWLKHPQLLKAVDLQTQQNGFLTEHRITSFKFLIVCLQKLSPSAKMTVN